MIVQLFAANEHKKNSNFHTDTRSRQRMCVRTLTTSFALMITGRLFYVCIVRSKWSVLFGEKHGHYN
jgi:hypothetical protein